MRTPYTVTLAMLAGFGLGAVAVQGLHAQAKPPVYYIAEIETSNLDAYMKDYARLRKRRYGTLAGASLLVGQRSQLKETRPRHALLFKFGIARKRYRRGATQLNIRRRAKSVTNWQNSVPSLLTGCLNKAWIPLGPRPRI